MLDKANFEKIEKIIQLGDIHVRNLKRHTEYNHVFKRLYATIKQLKKQNKNTVICLMGDIAHAKTDMSPELVDMIQGFLRKLADILPTIVILGNHDANLNNEQRLDVLSPIISALNHLLFLKTVGFVPPGVLPRSTRPIQNNGLRIIVRRYSPSTRSQLLNPLINSPVAFSFMNQAS